MMIIAMCTTIVMMEYICDVVSGVLVIIVMIWRLSLRYANDDNRNGMVMIILLIV